MRILALLAIFSIVSSTSMFAQAPENPATPPREKTVPIYRVAVVQRSLQAVNFERHAAPTHLDLKGTVLLPKAEGDAKVQVKNGYTALDVSFKNLNPPTQFGTEFLAYVLWAITPDGHSINLGEVIPDASNKATMHVTCPNSTFGLLVTAEPYFGVPYPSDVVVLQSYVRPDTIGRVEPVEAKYDLLPRGQYTLNIKPQELPSAHMNASAGGVSMNQYEAILELYEARNAVQIAKADGAQAAAMDTFGRAQDYLNQAEAAYARKDYNTTMNTAHQAVQAASDARTIAMREKSAGR